jgi:uncharacterized protein YndB with AHSA1/START domain
MAETEPIVVSVEVDAAPARVFTLLTEPAALVTWWADVAELEPRVGGRVRLVFELNEITGRITRFEPPSTLAFTWTPPGRPDVETEVTFTLAELAPERCRVEVVHSGWEHAPELRPPHQVGWRHYLGCLADLVAGRPVDKTFPEVPV